MRIPFESILSPQVDFKSTIRWPFISSVPALEEEYGLPNVSTVLTSHSAPFLCHTDGVLFWTRVLGAAVWFEKGLVRGESRFNGPRLVDVCALVSEEFGDSSSSVNISTVRLTWFWILLPRPDWITLFFGAGAAAAAATLQPLLKPLVVSFRFEPSHMDAVIIRALFKADTDC